MVVGKLDDFEPSEELEAPTPTATCFARPCAALVRPSRRPLRSRDWTIGAGGLVRGGLLANLLVPVNHAEDARHGACVDEGSRKTDVRRRGMWSRRVARAVWARGIAGASAERTRAASAASDADVRWVLILREWATSHRFCAKRAHETPKTHLSTRDETRKSWCHAFSFGRDSSTSPESFFLHHLWSPSRAQSTSQACGVLVHFARELPAPSG